ncbi:MAG: ATP-binding protein, partial [Rubrobacteraceae bacterium]
MATPEVRKPREAPRPRQKSTPPPRKGDGAFVARPRREARGGKPPPRPPLRPESACPGGHPPPRRHPLAVSRGDGAHGRRSLRGSREHRGRTRDTSAYRAATELYAGELLPEDRYEEWADERRGELRSLYISLLVELAAFYEANGEYAPAIEALRKVVAGEGSHEGAHVALMRLFALRGERVGALSQFGELEDALGRLGAEPSAASRRLYEEISDGAFPRDAPESRAWRAEGEGRHNLPLSRASFVGREREMAEVKRSLSMTQLLTLTGTGGCGKTRLAAEVARSLSGAYPGGVWMARLAPLSDGSLVARTVAGILGVREQPGRPMAQTLSEYLRTKDVLLVLDNCEHLVDAAAWLSDELLASCENLRILAPSRESLGVSGEVVWRVSTLTSPEEGESAEGMLRYEAVRLFVDRARGKLPAFELTEANARSVSEVCRRLDGIPLAIELATARMAALAIEQVAERLNDSLNLLALGERAAEGRHRTMRATLEWSHDLLDEWEKTLFRRLSVFAGGWTLEAAEEVGGASVLDPLESLVEKSLVVADAGGNRGMRYRMLEPVRQYAREKLDASGEVEEVRGRHAEYY